MVLPGQVFGEDPLVLSSRPTSAMDATNVPYDTQCQYLRIAAEGNIKVSDTAIYSGFNPRLVHLRLTFLAAAG